MQNLSLDNEHEAAVAILFACVMANNKKMNQSQIEQLSRMLVLSSRFRDTSLNELTKKALSLLTQHGSKALIEEAAPLIEEDFRDTLFAMCCELMTSEGRIEEAESEVLGMVALYLGLSLETMRMMLTTYLIRNRYNVQIVEA